MLTCATCANYTRPGEWSAHCRLGPPSWAWFNPNSPEPRSTVVRADNRCTKHSALDARKAA